MSCVRTYVPALRSNGLLCLLWVAALASTVEAGLASTVMTVAGIAAGLLSVRCLPSLRTWLACRLRVSGTLVGGPDADWQPAFVVLCVAGFVVALGETTCRWRRAICRRQLCPRGRTFNLAIGMAGINFGMALSPIVFEAVTLPFGATIDQKFIAGMIVCAACVVFGAIKYRKLTPAQLAEAERWRPAARQVAVLSSCFAVHHVLSGPPSICRRPSSINDFERLTAMKLPVQAVTVFSTASLTRYCSARFSPSSSKGRLA